MCYVLLLLLLVLLLLLLLTISLQIGACRLVDLKDLLCVGHKSVTEAAWVEDVHLGYLTSEMKLIDAAFLLAAVAAALAVTIGRSERNR